MMHLFDFLFPPRVDEIVVRGVSDEDILALIAPRLVNTTRPETVVLLPFSDPRVRSVTHEAKYHGSARAFELLALGLAEYLRDADDIRNPILVPVPLGRERYKERGFNQVEEVARYALKDLSGKEWGAVDTTLLVRTRETVSQVSLPCHEREENMRRAFGAAHLASPTCTYILIDDVTTTGATLQAAIDALTSAGAVHVIPLALAH